MWAKNCINKKPRDKKPRITWKKTWVSSYARLHHTRALFPDTLTAFHRHNLPESLPTDTQTQPAVSLEKSQLTDIQTQPAVSNATSRLSLTHARGFGCICACPKLTPPRGWVRFAHVQTAGYYAPQIRCYRWAVNCRPLRGAL